MTETDKLLVRIGTARDAISRKTEHTSLDYMIDGVMMNCSVMLKEQEEQKRKWLQNIADNQLANAPMDGCCLEQWNYQKGVYDGLQMAYDILTEGR